MTREKAVQNIFGRVEGMSKSQAEQWVNTFLALGIMNLGKTPLVDDVAKFHDACIDAGIAVRDQNEFLSVMERAGLKLVSV